MYNDTIKAENKIITHNDLIEIFQVMGETLKKYKKTYELEAQRNHMLDYLYQEYSFKDNGSKIRVRVDFYDNTEITFDNYDNFASIFYSRVDEIKSLDVYYVLNYSIVKPEPNRSNNSYVHSISMYISEKKIDITLNLNSEDPKLDGVYNIIKTKILNAPLKYDTVVKKKNSIINTIVFSKGLIPAFIICLLLLFVPTLNMFILKGYVVFPILCILLAFIIGNTFASSQVNKYYENIVPDKKYVGFRNGKSVYEDDLDKFLTTSEVLIGKKVNNLTDRQRIMDEYNKYKKFIKIELLTLLITSIIVIVIGFFV